MRTCVFLPLGAALSALCAPATHGRRRIKLAIQEQSAIDVLDQMVDNATIGTFVEMFETNGSPESHGLAKRFCEQWTRTTNASGLNLDEPVVAFSLV
jgi:hypothetical protein